MAMMKCYMKLNGYGDTNINLGSHGKIKSHWVTMVILSIKFGDH